MINNFKNGLAILIAAIVFILTIPFIILIYPFNYYRRKEFEQQYSRFLIQNDNLNFFCYNNRKNSREFIESEIIPNLSKEIEIIYLNGRVVENENYYPKEFLSNVLYQLKNYSKFPHLVKIRDGKLIDKSINGLFYLVKNNNKPKSKLIAEINDFFESK